MGLVVLCGACPTAASACVLSSQSEDRGSGMAHSWCRGGLVRISTGMPNHCEFVGQTSLRCIDIGCGQVPYSPCAALICTWHMLHVDGHVSWLCSLLHASTQGVVWIASLCCDVVCCAAVCRPWMPCWPRCSGRLVIHAVVLWRWRHPRR